MVMTATTTTAITITTALMFLYKVFSWRFTGSRPRIKVAEGLNAKVFEASAKGLFNVVDSDLFFSVEGVAYSIEALRNFFFQLKSCLRIGMWYTSTGGLLVIFHARQMRPILQAPC